MEAVRGWVWIFSGIAHSLLAYKVDKYTSIIAAFVANCLNSR